MSSASVVLVRQKAEWDCAPASLNCIAPHLRYADIIRAVQQLDRRWLGRKGLFNREVIALAAYFGIWLAPTRKASNLDTSTGILRIYWNRRDRRAKANPGGHAVAIHGGLILDPGTGDAMPWRAYQTRHGARLGTLLERV
jgi:hypothetical protein